LLRMGRLYQPNSDQTDRFALRAFRDLTNVSRSLLTLTPTPV
jgi:hypothetical protein